MVGGIKPELSIPYVIVGSLYSTVRWLVAARRTPELSKHGYSDTANILWDTIQSPKESLPVDDTIASLRRALGARLTFPDSRVAFAALWMLLEPDKHAPKTGSPFENGRGRNTIWNSITLALLRSWREKPSL